MKLDPAHLLEVCEPFDFAAPQLDPIELAQSLVRTMIDNRGLGLAANQVGVRLRVFAMFTQPENIVAFNPRIVDVGEEEVAMDEGCLSYPGMLMKIKRPKNIKVRFQLPNGETRTERFTGMTARVFLHELKHLDGEPFWLGESRLHFDRARRGYRGAGLVLFNGEVRT